MGLCKSHVASSGRKMILWINRFSSHREWLVSKTSSKYIDFLIEILKSTLAPGEGLLISGLGKFDIKNRKECRGRNPATHDDLTLAPRKGFTFKRAGRLWERINNE